MPQFDTHGSYFSCRAKCKSAQGADLNQCVPCAAFSEEQWTHLRENFAKRSAYRSRTWCQKNSFEEPDISEPVFTSEDLSRVDDSILDLEPKHSYSTAAVTSSLYLMSLPAPLPRSSQDIPTTCVIPGPVHQPHGDSSAFFKALIPVPQMVTHTTHPPQVPHTPGGHSVVYRMASLSFVQPQRIFSLNVPQTARTQMIKSHLEQ